MNGKTRTSVGTHPCKSLAKQGCVPIIMAFLIGACPYFSAAADYDSAVIQAVKHVKPAVVGIQTYRNADSENPVEVGSGIIYRSNGYILTNAHLLRGAVRIEVYTAAGKKYEGALVIPADEYDLAVVKIEAENLPTAQFGNSSRLELGQTAIAIGNPLSLGWTVTKGVISALNRNVSVRRTPYHHLIQTDAAINPGNSGGPLIDLNGRVIGINTLVYQNPNFVTQGLGFAIPAETAMAVASELLHTENFQYKAPRVRLGIGMYDLTPDQALQFGLPIVHGVIVESIEPNGPAAKAKLEAGDVLTKVDNFSIMTTESLIHYIRDKAPGSTVKFELWRRGIKQTVQVQLEANR